MNDHEKEQCERALVQCCYDCGGRIPRCRLEEHEQDESPQRPMDVKMESLMRKMEQRHIAEIAAVRKEFKREMENKDKAHNVEMDELKQSLKKCLAVQEEMKNTFTRAQQNADVAKKSTEESKRASMFTIIPPIFSVPQQSAHIAEKSTRTSTEEMFSQSRYPPVASRAVKRSDEKLPWKNLCRTVGCSFYAVPEYNHYCQNCWKG